MSMVDGFLNPTGEELMYRANVLGGICALLLMAGCQAGPEEAAVVNGDPAPGSQSSGSSAEQGAQEMSPLEGMLEALVSKTGAPWSSFDDVAGVQWRDPAPLENPDATSPDTARYRSGNLQLAGFGMVEVPDGQAGSEAGTKQDNEGNVGVTLNGDANGVQSVALLKFYPSENYAEILQRQIGAGGSVQLIADQCELDFGTTAENTQQNKFYRVTLATREMAYAEAYVDDGEGSHGPGSTTFVFYRSKPAQRISSMRCKEQ